VDLTTMTLISTYSGLTWPHGAAVNHDMTKLYITAQLGNYLYEFGIGSPNSLTNPDGPNYIKLENGLLVFTSKFDPHQVNFSPDGTKYYVTCQQSNEVRVMSAVTDSLLAVIPVGGLPQELEFSANYPYLFVSCMNDTTTNPGLIGSIYVINYQTNSFV